MKDGSDYQWMTNQGHQQPQQFHQQFPYGSHHSVYPSGSMGHHPYYAAPHAAVYQAYNPNDHQNGHPSSWSNNGAASAVDHHAMQSYQSAVHPLTYSSPHHDPSHQQYVDMFSPVSQPNYGYNSYPDPSWNTSAKEVESHNYSYDGSDHEAVTSLEMGMTALTVDTSMSDRALFSRDLEMYRKNQEAQAANQGKDSSWASVAAGSKTKTSMLKAKMMANAARSAAANSFASSLETSPNSSSYGESSKNGSSPKTPTTPSSSSVPESVPHHPLDHSVQEPRPWNAIVNPRAQHPGQQRQHPSFQERQPFSEQPNKSYTNGRQPNTQDYQNPNWRQTERRDNRMERTVSTSSDKVLPGNYKPKEEEIRVEKILERPSVSENRGRTITARNSASESEQISAVQTPSVPNQSTSSSSKAALKPVIDPSLVMDKQQLEHIYNPKTFDLEPVNARFFVIKSYSEDDIHRSIKYSIWCSTEHGNKRLDTAFKSQEGKGPVYLFYSVNGSGHFCGMAQMMSPLDYHSSANVWAQDKWKGQFKVKWIYVKDVPNAQLRHIRLENNENKPVTNSRDTQEVFADQGKQVLAIIHSYRHTTSIFDDYLHYEKRQEEVSRKSESELGDGHRHLHENNRPVERRDDFRRNDRGFPRRDHHPNQGYNRDNNFHSNQQSSYNSSNNYSRDNRNHHRNHSSYLNDRHDTHSSWRD